jgi:integrase
MAYFRKVKSKKAKSGYTWSFTAELGIDPTTGKRKQKTKRGFATKKDAEKAYNEFMSEFQKGIYIDSKNMTMKDLVEEWLEFKRNKLRPTTYRQRDVICKRWIIPFLGHLKLDQVKILHGQSFMTHLLKHLSPATANTIFSVTSSILNRAVQLEYIHKNPFSHIDRAKEKKKEIDTWSFEELQKFLQFVKEQNNLHYGIFAIAALTGMRKGEVLGLREKDVDFEKKRISVLKSVSEVKGKVYLSDVKTSKSRRSISLDNQTIAIINSQIKHNKLMKLRFGSSYQNEENIIFAQPNGALCRPTGLNKPFKRYAKEAGVPIISPHGLRHTHATLLLKMGIHTKIISERLGHAQVNITLDTYSHVLDDMQEEVSQILSENLKIL